MLHCLTRKTHQSSPPADGNSRLPWNGSSTAQWNEKMLGVQESKGLTMPQTYHFDSRCIVWFHHCVRHLWRRDHGEGFHNASVVRSLWKMSPGHVWKLEVEFGEGNRKELREHLQNVLQVRCGLDIPHALWRSAMCPFQRQCRHRENGKAGSPADLTFWVVKPKRTTSVFAFKSYTILEKKRKLETTVRQSGSYNYTVQDKHQSHPSASFRTTSSTESINSAPSV